MATAKKAAGKTTAAAKKIVKSTAKKTVAKKATPRGRAQDRRLVAGQQKHEVAYEASKTGASPGIVAEVVKAVGHARKKVESAIKGFMTEKKPARKAQS